MADTYCPACGGEPTDDSIVEQRLSDLGYHHTDITYECRECAERWQVGEPHGETSDDTWICDCCGGDFIPHFVYMTDEEVRCRPKCRDCHYVPDEPIRQETSTNGTTVRWFVGHHAVTGSRDDATDNSF